MNYGSAHVNADSFLELMVYRKTTAVISRLEDNRSRILAAARELVAEDGWRHAQIASVAQKAGVATGSVYRYFPSKADLFTEVLTEVSRRERDVIAAIVDGEGSATTRLVGAVKAFTRRALKGRRLAYAMIAEPCEPEIDKARLIWRAALSEEFVRLLAIGMHLGEFRRCDPRIAGACIVGAFMEALVGPLAPEDIPDDGAADVLVHHIVQACTAVVALPRKNEHLLGVG
jgi:AcrR family transcriptional regulator